MIKHEALEVVAIVAADRIFLKMQAGTSEAQRYRSGTYDRITEYQMERYGLTRDQLRIAVCLPAVPPRWPSVQQPVPPKTAAARDDDRQRR
mmetsp:Transcript_47435/g.88082  ORF Transcript_47435/g.88082 Transcript_47435/m.88082 type:complete len:91 (-) Transcript_47435:31-303(-)